MADYDWFTPTDAELELKAKGQAEAVENLLQGFARLDGVMHACRRGCGTVVWDIRAHRENVCRDENWNS